MKKTLLTLGVVLGMAAAPLIAADWCVATAGCGATAQAQIPPGGSCSKTESEFRAMVIVFDSAGNVVDADGVFCPIGPC